MIYFIKQRQDLLLYLFAFLILTWASDFAMPIEAIPDEIAQLKNVYAMIASKSLTLQYPTQFSIWIHYAYLPPTILYWISQYFSFDGSFLEFKKYVIENYQNVLPFLRMYTASVFLIGLALVRKVMQRTLNQVQGNLFFIFVVLNLLVVINSHYSKFWMMDFGLIFISLYLYMRYKESNKKTFLLSSAVIFSLGVLSNYSIFMFIVYFVLLHYYFSKDVKILIKEVYIVLFILILMFMIQLQLGAGGHIDMIKNDPIRFLTPNYVTALKLIKTQFDYDFVGTTLFFFSLLYMLFSKKKKMILLLIPYLLNLFFISTLHYEPRYALFLIIDGAFIATFLSFFLYKKYKLFFTILIFLFTISNSILIAGWLNLASSKDTRVEAIEWINNNTGSNDFLIYNTLGFNYVALHSKGIKIIQENFPKAITTRESLHLQYKLNDKTNGIILWKYAQAGYAARDLVRILSENKYNVFLINERFGSDSIHGHRLKDYLSDFEKSTTLELVKMINPFIENVNSEDKAMIGDVLYNFNSVWSTIFSLKRSGPTVSIYKVLEK